MAADSCGFVHPAVESSQCARCGACDKVCPVSNATDIPGDVCRSAWWMHARDAGAVSASSSGGVFGLLAEEMLGRGGLVCGASMENPCEGVEHVLVSDPGSLHALIGSKYVQSTVSRRVYEQVADALRGGRRVLFSGCGCHVAGMRSYLAWSHVPLNNFLGIEVVCHGAPSPALWRAWVRHIETGLKGAVASVNFRDKATTGWETYSITYADACGGALTWSHDDDWYMRAFLHNASIRQSCLTCPFKRRSGSDVVLGDYWGIANAHPEVDKGLGVSAVVANTQEGLAAIETLGGRVCAGATELASIAQGNPSLTIPASPSRYRQDLLGTVTRGLSVGEMIRAWPFKDGITEKARGLARKVLGRLRAGKRG